MIPKEERMLSLTASTEMISKAAVLGKEAIIKIQNEIRSPFLMSSKNNQDEEINNLVDENYIFKTRAKLNNSQNLEENKITGNPTNIKENMEFETVLRIGGVLGITLVQYDGISVSVVHRSCRAVGFGVVF